MRRSSIAILSVLTAMLGGAVQEAAAVLTQIGEDAFASASLIDFGPTQTFAPINGQVIGGVTFGYTIGGLPSLDATIADGPGNTFHITVANIEGSSKGVLSILFPSPQELVGYGWAASLSPSATTIELFGPGHISLGTLSQIGLPDPFFVGGFFGIASDMPFVEADVTFTNHPGVSQVVDLFAFDNLRFASTPVPEPATLLLLGAGLAGLAGTTAWRKRGRN
jgi:PEP-CTERM motif